MCLDNLKTNQRSYYNLWKVSLKILNSGLILKTFTHELNNLALFLLSKKYNTFMAGHMSKCSPVLVIGWLQRDCFLQCLYRFFSQWKSVLLEYSLWLVEIVDPKVMPKRGGFWEDFQGFAITPARKIIDEVPPSIYSRQHYTIIDFNEVDMRIYLPKKVIFTEAAKPRWISLLRVDKSSCLPKLKSIAVLLYDFLTMNEFFLLSLLLLKSCST